MYYNNNNKIIYTNNVSFFLHIYWSVDILLANQNMILFCILHLKILVWDGCTTHYTIAGNMLAQTINVYLVSNYKYLTNSNPKHNW